MRRIGYFLIALLLVIGLPVGVSAAISASSVGSHSTAARDGSCQVTMTVTLQLDQVRNDLEFPIPAEATSVTVNGTRTRATVSGNVRIIDLDKILGKSTGTFSLNISYTLPDVIHPTSTKALELRIPLLSGFAYPIRAMDFSVTLPGAVTTLPAFESGYHQANIERHITYEISGPTVTGTFIEELKDHETVTMKLLVDPAMFPQTLADTQDYTVGLIGMAVCAGLALVYWLIWMRNWPFRRQRDTEPPQGYTAGEMGCVLNLQGVDLHLTVLTWAQRGYLWIQIGRSGKVRLHKQMDMGNECREEEQRLFNKLFYKRDTVDTDSYQYAQLCRSVAKKPMGVREMIHRRSGNPKVFRLLASGIGLFGGISLAIALSGGAVLQGLLILVLGALGGLSGWYVQQIGACVVIRHRFKLIRCIAICLAWILLGVAAQIFSVGLWMVLGLVVAGMMYAWGGRRTPSGTETAARVLGLRQYMRRVDKLLLQRRCGMDPEYFFAMAPYAMALGVEKTFAARFGGKGLQDCPYITMQTEGRFTAIGWMAVLRALVTEMDRRARFLPLEKLFGMLHSMRK